MVCVLATGALPVAMCASVRCCLICCCTWLCCVDVPTICGRGRSHVEGRPSTGSRGKSGNSFSGSKRFGARADLFNATIWTHQHALRQGGKAVRVFLSVCSSLFVMTMHVVVVLQECIRPGTRPVSPRASHSAGRKVHGKKGRVEGGRKEWRAEEGQETTSRSSR